MQLINALLIVLFMLCAGCASQQPLSNYARPGDTVMISLGGTNNYATVPVVKKENLSITITDALSASYPVKVRKLFRVYSDPTSGYDFRTRGSTFSSNDSTVRPHQGLWLAIIDLVDGSNNPLPLAVGSASLSVSSPDLVSTSYFSGWPWTNGDLNNIPLEILTGTGSPNPLNYMAPVKYEPTTSLEPLPQVQVAASGTPSTVTGGASYVFSYRHDDFGTGLALPYVVTTTPDPYIQLGVSRADQGDGTTLLRVNIINPKGFNTDDSKSGLIAGMSMLSSLKFSIVWSNPAVDDSNWQNSLQLISSDYFDLNGDPITGLTPQLTKVR